MLIELAQLAQLAQLALGERELGRRWRERER